MNWEETASLISQAKAEPSMGRQGVAASISKMAAKADGKHPLSSLPECPPNARMHSKSASL